MSDQGPEALAALIAAADAHDADATDRLFTLLYAELRRLAQQELQRMGGKLTLGPGTLLHETYLKLARRGAGVEFPDRARFMGYAAKAMRGLIIDYARRRQALKRGGGIELTSLDADGAAGAIAGDSPTAEASATAADRAAAVEPAEPVEPLERLDSALTALARQDPLLAELVDLKYFGGLSITEIAALRGVTERTVSRHWEKARMYLFHVLEDDGAALFGTEPASQATAPSSTPIPIPTPTPKRTRKPQ